MVAVACEGSPSRWEGKDLAVNTHFGGSKHANLSNAPGRSPRILLEALPRRFALLVGKWNDTSLLLHPANSTVSINSESSNVHL